MPRRLLLVLAVLVALAPPAETRAAEVLLDVDVTGDYAERCLVPGFGYFDCLELRQTSLSTATGESAKPMAYADLPPRWSFEMLSLEPGGPPPKIASSNVLLRYFQPGYRTDTVPGPVGNVNVITGPDRVIYEAAGVLDWRIVSGRPIAFWRVGGVSPLSAVERSAGFGMVTAYDMINFSLTPGDGSVQLGINDNSDPPGPPYYTPINAYGPTRVTQLVRIGLPPGTSVRGPVEGTLVSSVPTQTPGENEVHEATLSLYVQDGGRARAQGPGEEIDDYEDYLLGLQGPLEARLAIRRDPNALANLTGPGEFRFDAVPAYRDAPSSSGSGRTVAEQLYFLVVVEDAATEEDSLGVPGQKETLTFRRRVVGNLVPGEDPVTIPLDPITGIGQKRAIAQTLIQLCDLNYGPVEGSVLTYLTQLENGTIEYTRGRAEGVLRATWAERSARIGHQYADELIQLFLRGLGTLIADAFDDLAEFETASLRRAKARVEKWQQSGGQSFATGLSTGVPGDLRKANQILDDRALVKNAGAAKLTLELVKAAKLGIQYATVQAAETFGLSAQAGETAASILGFALETVLNAVLSAGNLSNGAFPGGLKPALKLAIDQAIQALRPALVDGVSPAYCALTQPSLAYARDELLAWEIDDRPSFAADRAQLADDLNATGEQLGDEIVAAFAFLEIGGALDQASDIFGAAGNVNPQAKIAATLSKVGKYASNGGATFAAGATAFLGVPRAVERWTRLAFGDPVPPAGGGGDAQADDGGSGGGPGGGSALGSAAADVTALRQALDALRGEVASGAVATAIARATSDAPAGLPALLSAWDQSVGLFTTRLAAHDPAVPNASLDAARTAFEQAQADLLPVRAATSSLLAEWASGVLADWSGPSDPAYGRTRARLVGALAVTSTKIGALAQRITALDALLPAAAPAAVTVAPLTVVSQATGESVISASPESFTATARVRNLSGQALTGLSARLRVDPDSAPVVIAGGSDRAIGALAADDGAASGPDEAVVSWSFTWSGAPGPSALVVAVELLEGGAAPTTFLAAGGLETLLVDPALYDGDLDGLPDDFEDAHGLDPGADDAALDDDADGLANARELALGTDPDDSDTDGDGRSDGAERSAASASLVSDPLDPDSDDDGTPDGSDGAPNDATTAAAGGAIAEPRVAVDRTSVVLDAADDVAAIAVTNAGAGELAWTVVVDDPALIDVSPEPGERRYGPRQLYVTARDGFDFATLPSLTTRIRVLDASGGTPDVREVQVVLLAVPEPGAAAGGVAAALALAACARRRALTAAGSSARSPGSRAQPRRPDRASPP